MDSSFWILVFVLALGAVILLAVVAIFVGALLWFND
jgi:hypothetical protein